MNDYYLNSYYYYIIIIKNVQLPGLCTPQWRSSFENGEYGLIHDKSIWSDHVTAVTVPL